MTQTVPQPVAKRADQLVVGDRILPEFLPAAAREPGEALYVRLYTYGGDPWVFVAFLLPDGLVEAAHYLPDRKVEVYPAPDATGQLYSRADDGETTQPIAGRIPPHFESGRTVVEVAGGLVEIDPPEGFVLATSEVPPWNPEAGFFEPGRAPELVGDDLPSAPEGFVPASAPYYHLFGLDAGPEGQHSGGCEWPQVQCIGHASAD